MATISERRASAAPVGTAAAPFGDLVERGELEAALRGLALFMRTLVEQPAALGADFPFPELDTLCADIGRRSAFRLFGGAADLWPAAHDVVVVTEASVQGGHAEIVRDIAEWSTRPVLVVATNLFDRAEPLLPWIRAHHNVPRTVALDGGLLDRLRTLQALLRNPAAQRVHVLCHAHDTVAVAGCADLGKPTLFFHHCDHAPCLGCFLPGATHLDLHALAADRCRRALGPAARYVCLTSRETTKGRADGRFATPRFSSVTCGGEHKLARPRYPIGYADVLVRLIAVTGGVHYHVGPLSDATLTGLRDRLGAAGLPPASFVHVGHVAGFREIVSALEVDLYLPTLPQSGGKALVDAMAAGLPILAHDNAIDRLWGSRDLVYPAARSWSTLDALDREAARLLDEGHWRAQARASQEHYRAHHANALFARQLAADGTLPLAPPPLQPYRPDLTLRLGVLGLHEALA